MEAAYSVAKDIFGGLAQNAADLQSTVWALVLPVVVWLAAFLICLPIHPFLCLSHVGS